MTQLLPPKKEVALALLERSNVDVYLDPRAKGVVVPPQFRKEPRLILKIGLNMPVPIPDLRVDDDSMSCTLSFNRSPFYCVVPWSSVFAMVGEDGRGMVWPDDVPQELAVKVVEPGEGDEPRAPGARPAGAAPASASSGSGGGRRNAKAPARERSPSGSGDDVAADRPAAKGGAGKRKKKKEEQGTTRPVLVALPSPDAGAPPAPAEADVARVNRGEAAGSERPREIRQPPGSRRPAQPAPPPRDGVSAVPSSRPRQPPPPSQRPPADGQARPKRELPPYLRVVK
jgi:stringent starvation protein B